jgi:tRNA pseudouridine38-40 synthase
MNAKARTPLSKTAPRIDEQGTRAYRLLVEYEGTAYAGWQIQKKAPSVQAALETALESLTAHPVRMTGSGRTDAGVHALGQVARFVTNAPRIGPEAIVRGGNTKLPADIRILEAERCDDHFDPRRDARLRWYRYSIVTRPVAPALDRHRLLHMPHAMDWDRVEAGLKIIRGEHDFSAFRSSRCTAKRTLLTMEHAALVHAGEHYHIDLKCRSFLHNMVRLLVGLLLEVGQGRHDVDVIRQCLEAQEKVARFRTAPPHGLVLMRVYY